MLTLQLHTLCEFVNAIRSSRNLMEGQKVANSGMIIMCGVTSKSNEGIRVVRIMSSNKCINVRAPHNYWHTKNQRLEQ